ncbi:MAG: 3-phosphoserine/phosphohydroxythreonine transaminase [Methylococcales bacterium]|nr:3-phosphoserine/phosphohydroxythreonine transaminase [Methylococcales bacterium]
MSRVYNFSAGPSALPEEVLKQAAVEMLDWRGSGLSVMEMSHRGKHFQTIAEELEADLRALMAIPDNYKVLFLQGGATAQFSFVPLNLVGGHPCACYVDTGAWSAKALQTAKAFTEVHVAASSATQNYSCVPDPACWRLDVRAAYLHYTANETIHGVEFPELPDAQGLPLVCDMSSNILSRPVDVSRFGLIYAGSQKNMGPSGVTVVIVRDDLLGKARADVPDVFNYTLQAEQKSMLNTPATYNWYLVGLVLKWLQKQGGLAAIEAQNQAKATRLYDFIDASTLYRNPVAPAFRSRMNVPFILADQALDAEFLRQAEAAGMYQLKGHRSVGGMRASIYNAMPVAGVDALLAFMAEFERTH